MNKNYLLILTVFLNFFILPISAGSSDSDTLNAKEREENFKFGRLVNLTPSEINSSDIQTSEDGPLFIFVGVKRNKIMADFRPDAKREKFKFTVVKGQGTFVSIDDEKVKGENTLLISPNRNEVSEILFYPGTSGDSSVKVQAVGDPGIVGILNYDFHNIPLNKKDFHDLGRKIFAWYKWRSALPGTESIQRTTVSYCDDGHTAFDTKTQNITISMKTDGTRDVKEDGKSVSKPEKIPEMVDKNNPWDKAKPWGQTDKDLIFEDMDQMFEPVFSFLFYDKTIGVLDRQIVLTSNHISIIDFEYQPFGDHEIIKKESSESKDFSGLKTGSETINHSFQQY